MSSKINVIEILLKHKSTLENPEGKMLRRDRKHFVIYPILIALLLSIIIGIPNDNLVNIFAICLSVFVGLFLNLLVLIISFAENKLNIKDIKNRAELLEQTFYNITYTIVISLFALGILFLANVKFLPTDLVFSYEKTLWETKIHIEKLEYNQILTLIIYFIFNTVFAHLILTLLMIIKRIFHLFKVEIEEINGNKNTRK
ncbi:hypothetical protein AWW67_18030 [Roseivirga seohaensis]|uniref:Uncharacterized protein n=1 Tax=Roseivirga seohaensis TaxID=1914963 RepID=A0A150Y205_9BACT|nr:hypothetical protein [Roseivirga seohaensis]KYG84885.1 hypothetical protein AWW67_18030 [Roseivirga seohaensis]